MFVCVSERVKKSEMVCEWDCVHACLFLSFSACLSVSVSAFVQPILSFDSRLAASCFFCCWLCLWCVLLKVREEKRKKSVMPVCKHLLC